MGTEDRVWPDRAIPPGELLLETLETLGLTQADLARRAGRPAQAINEMVRGTKEITAETALQFERVLGVPAHIWTRLEADYRATRARLDDRKRLDEEIPLARKYPCAVMVRLGWVRRVRSRRDQVNEVLRFFGVASLRHVVEAHPAAFRRSGRVNASPEALAAWLGQGERLAHQVATAPFDEAHLRAALPEIRALATRSPEEFEPRLKQRLAACGVALVLVPHLPRTGAHGATRWFTTKAVVQMSLRYRWDDIFWFSLFHEIGHVLLHGRGRVFIEGLDGDQAELEGEADAFATDLLIPAAAWAAFVALPGPCTRPAVRTFAAAQGIPPSIVVGRLQHEGRLPHSHLNDLRSRFVWPTPPAPPRRGPESPPTPDCGPRPDGRY